MRKNAKKIVTLLTVLTLVFGCSTMAEAATSSVKVIARVTDLTTGKQYSNIPVISGHQLRLKISVKTTRRATMRLRVPGYILKGSSQSLSLTVKEKGYSARSVHKVKMLKNTNGCQLNNGMCIAINGKSLTQEQAVLAIHGETDLQLPKGKSTVVVIFEYDKILEPEPPEEPELKKSEPPELPEESDEPIGPCEGCRRHLEELGLFTVQ